VPTQINTLPIQLANPAQLIDRKADSDIIEIKNSAKFLGPVLLDPALLTFVLRSAATFPCANSAT
jgi:hypothetical protein